MLWRAYYPPLQPKGISVGWGPTATSRSSPGRYFSQASSGASSLDALSLDAIVVSEKQEEDIEFNKQKLLKQKAAAFSSGSLLPNEADDTVKAAVRERHNKNKKSR